MPVKPEFEHASYYLTRAGDLLFTTLPLEDADPATFVKRWSFKEIGRSPQAFFEFLRESRLLGASEGETIRIIAESHLADHLPDILAKLGIHGKEIVYTRKPVWTNPISVK
jgi:hypothetical protein